MIWSKLARQRPFAALRRLGVLAGLSIGAVLLAVTPVFADDRPDGSEMATAASMMVVITLFFIVAVVGIWWAWNNGEFAEPEETKYEMLAMTEDEIDYWGIGTHDDDLDEEEMSPRRLIAGSATS